MLQIFLIVPLSRTMLCTPTRVRQEENGKQNSAETEKYKEECGRRARQRGQGACETLLGELRIVSRLRATNARNLDPRFRISRVEQNYEPIRAHD